MSGWVVGLLVTIGLLGGFFVGDRVGLARHVASTPVVGDAPSGAIGAGAGDAPSGAIGAGATAGRGPGGGGQGRGGGVLSGTIVATAPGIITVQERSSGREVKVAIGQARITRSTDAGAADLTAQSQVTVFGQAGADGTVTARSIAIGQPPGRPSPSPSPSG